MALGQIHQPEQPPGQVRGGRITSSTEPSVHPLTRRHAGPADSADLYSDRSELKYYRKGQFDNIDKNEKYPEEYYDTLLFALSAAARHNDPRYAKAPLSEEDFDFSCANIDKDFLYHPQQAELFVSPAGSWSDIHIGIRHRLTDLIQSKVC